MKSTCYNHCFYGSFDLEHAMITMKPLQQQFIHYHLNKNLLQHDRRYAGIIAKKETKLMTSLVSFYALVLVLSKLENLENSSPYIIFLGKKEHFSESNQILLSSSQRNYKIRCQTPYN